jgi:hypothetical protein
MWVFIQSERGLWTVGHYDPAGEWQPESDHNKKEEAACRVMELNGNNEMLKQMILILNEKMSDLEILFRE